MLKATVITRAPLGAHFSSASAPPGRAQIRAETRPVSPVSKFILVIDNSPTIQRVVEMTLLHEGYAIRSFGNGIDAMRWFAGPEARVPDLMLVELDLPKMDGCDVIQKFKAKPRFANTTCILLSQREQVPEQFKSIGTILRKPFTAQGLVVAVRDSIASVST